MRPSPLFLYAFSDTTAKSSATAVGRKSRQGFCAINAHFAEIGDALGQLQVFRKFLYIYSMHLVTPRQAFSNGTPGAIPAIRLGVLAGESAAF